MTLRSYFSEEECRAVGFSEPMVQTLKQIADFVQAQLTITTVVEPIGDLTTFGLMARVGDNLWATRSIVVPAAGVSITFADGVADNPTLALANDLAALEALAATGFSVRTATDTWAQRSIVVTSGHLTVSNGDGVAGNPTLGLPNSGVTAGAYTNASVTFDAQGRATAASSGTAGAGSGAVGGSGLTMSTARLLGRTTASTGAIEEITVGSGLTLSAGSLSGAYAPPVISSQSGTTYTAVLGDANTFIRFTSGSSVTFTIPPNSSVAFPVNTEIHFSQSGAGSVTVAPGAAVTINSRASDLTLAGQYAVAFVKQVAADTWIMNGDL